MISELMRRLEISDEKIKADLMYRLLRKHCWGVKYLPLDTLINWMSKRIRRTAKELKDV